MVFFNRTFEREAHDFFYFIFFPLYEMKLLIVLLFFYLANSATISVSPCTYAQINASINSAAAGDTLNLQCSGTTVIFPQLILITKSVIIDGNNGTFDGQSLVRFFAVGPRARTFQPLHS